MKKSPVAITARVTLTTLFLLSSIALFCAIPLIDTRAQNPASGTVNATGTQTASWVGTTVSPGGNTSESTCMDDSPILGCETFTLTVSGTQANWAGKKVQVLLSWTNSANEYDI